MDSVALDAKTSELHKLVLAARRCVNCAETACLAECQLRADLRRALASFVPGKPFSAWLRDSEGAETFADAAIQESFA